jgi:hypothetical protein
MCVSFLLSLRSFSVFILSFTVGVEDAVNCLKNIETIIRQHEVTFFVSSRAPTHQLIFHFPCLVQERKKSDPKNAEKLQYLREKQVQLEARHRLMQTQLKAARDLTSNYLKRRVAEQQGSLPKFEVIKFLSGLPAIDTIEVFLSLSSSSSFLLPFTVCHPSITLCFRKVRVLPLVLEAKPNSVRSL